jgi:cysteine-rich repeat protein
MLQNKWLTALLAATLVVGMAQRAVAHRAPMPIALWGGFDRAAAHCQRIIGRAAARCGRGVWAARAACLATQVAGGTCDQAETEASVQLAHQRALDLIDRYCADYAVDLGFTLTLEAQTDIDTFCQQLDAALVSGVYGPLLGANLGNPASDAAATCVSATAAAATRLLRIAFRSRTRALDRIAGAALPPSEKLTIIARSAAMIERARVALGQRLSEYCPDERFVALYGRSADVVLALIAQRGDCLGGAAYVQNAVLCPAAVCGNGMVEPAEQCDDGNTVGGDGCDATCQSEGSQPLQ